MASTRDSLVDDSQEEEGEMSVKMSVQKQTKQRRLRYREGARFASASVRDATEFDGFGQTDMELSRCCVATPSKRVPVSITPEKAKRTIDKPNLDPPMIPPNLAATSAKPEPEGSESVRRSGRKRLPPVASGTMSMPCTRQEPREACPCSPDTLVIPKRFFPDVPGPATKKPKRESFG